MIWENDFDYYLYCPVDVAIKYKENAKSQVNSTYLQKLKKETAERVDVVWLKNELPLHRPNGNPILSPDGDNKTKLFIGIGLSDAGTYTCLLDYRNVSKEASKYLSLHPSITFNLIVEARGSLLPDTKPTISHPPANQLVKRGSNVTFTCNKIVTMTNQITYWFKSNQLVNETQTDKFLKAYNSCKQTGHHSHLVPYLIKNSHNDELNLFNVSDKDAGYYGCLVSNPKGIDVRIAQLELLEPIYMVTTRNYDTTTSNPPTTTMFSTTSTYSDTSKVPVQTTTQPKTEIVVAFDYQQNTSTLVQSFPNATVLASIEPHNNWSLIGIPVSVIVTIVVLLTIFKVKECHQHSKKQDPIASFSTSVPIVGNKEANIRQHLPNGDLPNIYSSEKTTEGFISGRHQQSNGQLMSQSIYISDKETPSISSNSNSDEASYWGKLSDESNNSRASYLHTSNLTTTTVPMYDHPPSTGAALNYCGAIVQDACVINPTYGFVRLENESSRWAFPRRDLKRLDKIGEGQFGEVWRYIANQKDGQKYVAVKQLKDRAGLGDRERLELIAEIEIMKSVNAHPNVIKLLYYCADGFEPILLVMEYAENGKLQTYLRNCRSYPKAYGCLRDQAVSAITSKDLIKFSYHIAKGMEYVASKGIIHRDLASRNILVSKDKICKVADFGFARRIGDDCAYERSTANPVPIKWMAPEALVENKFTSKSDVFSLGILMWEIVTLGATPYEYLNSSEVYRKVTSGGRLEKPAHCRDEFFNIMATCWMHDPAQRPTFKELADQLEKLLMSKFDYIELDQYPEHAYYNILNDEKEKDVMNI